MSYVCAIVYNCVEIFFFCVSFMMKTMSNKNVLLFHYYSRTKQVLKKDPSVATLLIISELKGRFILLQQHPCLWPYNSKAHYTSALTITPKRPL